MELELMILCMILDDARSQEETPCTVRQDFEAPRIIQDRTIFDWETITIFQIKIKTNTHIR